MTAFLPFKLLKRGYYRLKYQLFEFAFLCGFDVFTLHFGEYSIKIALLTPNFLIQGT